MTTNIMSKAENFDELLISGVLVYANKVTNLEHHLDTFNEFNAIAWSLMELTGVCERVLSDQPTSNIYRISHIPLSHKY